MSKKDYRNSQLMKMLQAQKEGKPVGIYSICSANRFVIEACMLYALKNNAPVLIESTSNQVNQFGGYTGMTPKDFVKYVQEIAASVKFPFEKVILGGDHLGPNVWQNEPAVTAMAKARDLVRDYVLAGFEKIHLDASMRLGDDPGDKHTPLKDEVVAARAAELCKAAEEAYTSAKTNAHAPLYVIGTEVPIPGGAQEAEETLAVTKVKDAEHTIKINQEYFYTNGLQAAWERVIAVVVQPGVEFGDATVFGYQSKKAQELSHFIDKFPKLVYEAHSTDYQTPDELKDLVKDHFAILKVGPWLTFALREALFALEEMERELLSDLPGIMLSDLTTKIEQVMLANPGNWQKHYHGDARQLAFARKYSYSDRVRYYWGDPNLTSAIDQLIRNLEQHPVPLSLLSQFMPVQYHAVRAGEIDNKPVALIHHKIITDVAKVYMDACGRI